jgi:hypothetical protein
VPPRAGAAATLKGVQAAEFLCTLTGHPILTLALTQSFTRVCFDEANPLVSLGLSRFPLASL